MEAFDLAPSAAIGASHPISFSNITQSEEPIDHELDLYDATYKLAGTAKITTQFVYRELDPLPPNLNSKCSLKLTIVEGNWFKDEDMVGK